MERNEIVISDVEKLPIANVIHRIDLCDKESKAKECNKRVSILIRKGLSKDPKYKWYPYWSVEILSESGQVVTWTPTKELTLNFIEEFFIHEARVDLTRRRKSDVDVYKQRIRDIIMNVQAKIHKWVVPEVYKQQ